MINWILLVVAVAVVAAGYFWRKSAVKRLQAEAKPSKRQKRPKTLATITIVIGTYLFATRVLNLIFGSPAKEELRVNLFAERVELFGLNLSTTIIYTWYAMAFLIIVALVLRLTVIRKMKDRPGGAQNVLEAAVEAVINYVHSKAHGMGEGFSTYIFTIAAFLIACAILELFGFHTPAADITMTFALALITFILINYFGIRKKGLKGRIKALASPSPAFLPIRLITDFALPISMSARLFGNMLGGMIVIDLIYSSLGNYAIGIPSALGLYFNVFHPLIQAFIFITLTLTFINEATE
ncbi:MAG: F0F1 ATP synthase subunit A [Clostridiales bacterium]|nr:F0F1 ATP synthase subunit A [Clostridiales bacterium]